VRNAADLTPQRSALRLPLAPNAGIRIIALTDFLSLVILIKKE